MTDNNVFLTKWCEKGFVSLLLARKWHYCCLVGFHCTPVETTISTSQLSPAKLILEYGARASHLKNVNV